VLWWGFGLYALAYSGEWLSLVSPVLMTVLILKVSGVPMLEESMKKRHGFAEYAASTHKFFPWWPKKNNS
jgi:steroid 5-alpha reductase family enzyme